MEYLICTKCQISKELIKDNFYYRKSSNTWVKQCKCCILLKEKDKYAANSDHIKKAAAIYRSNNKEKIRNHATNYNNQQNVKDRSKEWRQKNKKLLRLKEKEWRLKNPEKYKIISKRKIKVQSKKPTFKLKAHVSRQVNFALHSIGKSKLGNSVVKFLPYTIKELKEHLEKNFEPWMTWDNYGIYRAKMWDDNDQLTWRWQIDHIIPQSNFSYTSMKDEDFCKCWSLNNLRPYSAKQNCLDGATRIRHK